MTDEQQTITTEEAVAPKPKRAAAPKKPIVEQEETNEVPKSDKIIHAIILGSLVLLGIAATQVLNTSGLLGDKSQQLHEQQLKFDAYRDGIRDVKH